LPLVLWQPGRALWLCDTPAQSIVYCSIGRLSPKLLIFLPSKVLRFPRAVTCIAILVLD
jgi:hypothetical protein